MAKHPLKVWRKSKGLTLDALAKQIGVTREAVRLWEDKGTIPSPKRMQRIFKATDGEVHPEHFYKL